MKIGKPTENIGNALLQLAEVQFDSQLKQEIKNFTFAFTIHQQRPKQERQASRLPADNRTDLLDHEILDLHMQMVQLGVLDETIGTPANRPLLPFLTFDPHTRQLQVKIIPYTGNASSGEEMGKSLILMRDIEDFLHDASVRPEAHLHLRALLKAFFANIYAQLHHGRPTRKSLQIDYAKALPLLQNLEFIPGESLRSITYEDKYEKFKTLMAQKGFRFDADRQNFRKWVTTASEDQTRARICQTFDRDLEFALQGKTDHFKTTLISEFQKLAEAEPARIA